MSSILSPPLLSTAPPDTLRTTTPGFCWGSPRGWRTRGQPTFCPANLATPGSGTAATSRQRHWLLSRSSLCSFSSPSVSSAQSLPQHGRVQPVRAAGRRHAEAGRRGTQGQLLSGGHVLRLGILSPLRLHLTHAGGPHPELAMRAVVNHASLLSETLCLDTGFESRLLWHLQCRHRLSVDRHHRCVPWKIHPQGLEAGGAFAPVCAGSPASVAGMGSAISETGDYINRISVCVCVCVSYVVLSSCQVTVNPKQQVPESSFDNNVARCDVQYTGSSAHVSGCTTTSWEGLSFLPAGLIDMQTDQSSSSSGLMESRCRHFEIQKKVIIFHFGFNVVC